MNAKQTYQLSVICLLVLVFNTPATSAIRCYRGSAVYDGCNACLTVRYYINASLHYDETGCSTTGCTPGVTMYRDRPAVSYCCYYDLCNALPFNVNKNLTCYEGQYSESIPTYDTCPTCQTITYSSILGLFGSYKTMSLCSSRCVDGKASWLLASAESKCCYTDKCNEGKPDDFYCYERKLGADADTISAKRCTACEKVVMDLAENKTAVYKACSSSSGEKQCVAGPVTPNATRYCCESALCNDAVFSRQQMVPALILAAIASLWCLL